MRFLLAGVLAVAACGGSRPLHTLSLSWRGVDGGVTPAPAMAAAFAAVPLAFAVRDVRPDPYLLGTEEDSGLVIRTGDNVAQYCSNQLGQLLRNAGARMEESPAAVLESDLLEYQVDEGGTFKGRIRLRITVRRPGAEVWTKIFEGTSTRWGRSHSPDNFNEALSNALAEVAEKVVHDDGLARALMARAPSPT